MKYLERNEALCIGCGACEEVCSKTFFKEVDPAKSCVKVTPKDNGVFQISACTQCGICANECPTMALSKDARGVVRMNKKTCVGCNICVGYCPENAMMRHEDILEPFKCTACGLCVKQCPTGALTIVNTEV